MPRRLSLPVAIVVVGSIVAGCGGDDGPDVGDERAAQIREAAEAAGLTEEVAKVLEVAARGSTSTFRVTFRGDDGSTIVVAQAPPDRRIDVLVGGTVVESRVLRGGVGYACTTPTTPTEVPTDAATPPNGSTGVPGPPGLTCERRAGDVRTEGVFTTDALEDFTANLAASKDDVVLAVEARTIAGVEATCLVSSPSATTPTDAETGSETICLSPEGAQLLVDAGGERVTATEYGTDVPRGTFDVTIEDRAAGDM